MYISVFLSLYIQSEFHFGLLLISGFLAGSWIEFLMDFIDQRFLPHGYGVPSWWFTESILKQLLEGHYLDERYMPHNIFRISDPTSNVLLSIICMVKRILLPFFTIIVWDDICTEFTWWLLQTSVLLLQETLELLNEVRQYLFSLLSGIKTFFSDLSCESLWMIEVTSGKLLNNQPSNKAVCTSN